MSGDKLARVDDSLEPGSNPRVAVKVITYGQEGLRDRALETLIAKLSSLKSVKVVEENPQFVFHVAVSLLEFTTPDALPLGLAVSVVISEPAENYLLWKRRKEFSKEAERQIVFALHQQEILIQQWQRGGDYQQFEQIIKGIVDDFEQEIVLPAIRSMGYSF